MEYLFLGLVLGVVTDRLFLFAMNQGIYPVRVFTALRQAIECALIYDPDADTYKIKHTVYPKLKRAIEIHREASR